MHTQTRLISSSLALLVTLTAVPACTSGPGAPPATGALTAGRVDAESGAAADVRVRAYGVEADGSLVVASEAVITDSSGRYSVLADLGGSATALVVRVEDGSDRMSLLSRSAFDAAVAAHADQAVTLAPITLGSTFDAEATIAAEALADDSASASLDTLFLTTALSSQLAANLDHEAAIEASARALLDARATFREGLESSATTGDLALALATMAELEADLAAALDTASTEAEVRAAWTAHLDASLVALTDAGYEAEAVATAAIASRSALDAHLRGHLGDSDASLSTFAAFAITGAVDVGFAELLEANAVTAAGASLRTELMALADADAGADAHASAWARYEVALVTALEARLGSLAAVVAELTGSIDTSASGLASAWASLGTTASARARVGAYASYVRSVSSGANLTALVGAGLTEAEATASLRALAAAAVMTR